MVKQTIHIIDDTEYVLLRDAARERLVTPQALLTFMLSSNRAASCYRKINGEYKITFLDTQAKLTFDKRNSLLVPSQAVDRIPVIDASALTKSLFAHFSAVAELLAAREQYRHNPRWRGTNSPEYRTYLTNYDRLQSAESEVAEAEEMLKFVCENLYTDKFEPTLRWKYLKASIDLRQCAENARQAAFDESYWGSEFPEARPAYAAEYRAAVAAEESAWKNLLKIVRVYGEELAQRPSWYRVFGQYLLAEAHQAEAQQAYNRTDWQEDEADDAAAVNLDGANERQEKARTAFIEFWNEHALPEEVEARNAKIAVLKSYSELYFATHCANRTN